SSAVSSLLEKIASDAKPRWPETAQAATPTPSPRPTPKPRLVTRPRLRFHQVGLRPGVREQVPSTLPSTQRGKSQICRSLSLLVTPILIQLPFKRFGNGNHHPVRGGQLRFL